MLIDVTAVLKDLKGNPLRSNEMEPKRDADGEKIPRCGADGAQLMDDAGDPIWEMEPAALTLRDVILTGLGYLDQPNQNRAPDPNGKEKVRRYMLMQQVYQADGTVAIEAKDVDLIKNMIAKTFPSPLVVGQAFDLLDPGDSAEGPKAVN